MGVGGIAVACGFEIFGVRVDVDDQRADAAAHIADYLPHGRNYHRTAAKRGIEPHADGCAHEVGAGVVGKEPSDRFESIVAVAALMRAANDDVGFHPGDVGVIFVEIEIIASHVGKTHTIDDGYLGRRPLPHVGGIELELGVFTAHQVLLVVLVDQFSGTVVSESGVAHAGRGAVDGIDENDGVATLGGIGACLEQGCVVFFDGSF